MREVNYISVIKRNREIRIGLGHEVYTGDMVNHFDYYHSAIVPQAVNNRLVVDYSRPGVHKLRRSGVEFEFPSLPEPDESTDVYMETLALKPGEVVFDLGAYAGASSYFLAKAVGPEGLVAAFEPDEINYLSCSANIDRHALKNVRLFKKGVWSETTTLAFQAEGNMGSAASSIIGRASNLKMVEVVSLEDVLTLIGKSKVAAIKMDIEGAELAVLRGAENFLRQQRPRLVIEPHWMDGKLNTAQVCELLRSYGYSVKIVSEQGSQNWPLVVAHYPSTGA